MKFRPCIDLHQGVVKQIVGGSLREGADPATNFISQQSPSYYAQLYREDNLPGGHVIMLGPGNEQAAREAISAWPGGLQIGGGIHPENAKEWLDSGAAAVIVTSYVFRDGRVDLDNLVRIARLVGKERLVLDLSCRKRDGQYRIVTDRWQKFTETAIEKRTLGWLSNYCSEFLIHAADVEGLCEGVDSELVTLLGEITPIPTTYAGGARNLEDLNLVHQLGGGKLDITIGSALDLFGGTLAYRDVVSLHQRWNS